MLIEMANVYIDTHINLNYAVNKMLHMLIIIKDEVIKLNLKLDVILNTS